MSELIHLRLVISAGVVQSLAVMGSMATGRIWLDTANDHSCNGEVDGGVVHSACNGRQMQADVVEQRYRRLVDHSPDAIAVHEGGRVVYINHAGVRWIGAQSSAELVGHVITEFVHPNSVPAMLARIASLRHEGDTSPQSEAVMLRSDGTTLEVEAVSVLTVWEGRPAYQVIFRDLSAQRAAEAAVHRQAALVNQVSDAIIATTFAGIVTNWNPAAEAIYRRPAARALALPASEAVGAPLDPAAIIVHGGIVHSTHHAADGAALDVRVSATATTRAPEVTLIPGSGTSRWSGSSSSLLGRSRVSRRSACLPHASSTDTAAELAAADVNRHPVCNPFEEGLTRASISP